MSGLISGEVIGESEPTLDIGLFSVIFMPAVMPDIPIDIPVLLDTLLSRDSEIIKKHFNMSLVMRKPVFRVSDLVRHKPGCAVTDCDRRWLEA